VAGAVIVNYLESEVRAVEVVRAIQVNGGEAIPHRADITNEEAVHDMVHAAAERFGAVDILINNALPDYRFDP
jgi:3-oxoacyl-[acyl-carrier protein] reductase